jgi:hypothetical protein
MSGATGTSLPYGRRQHDLLTQRRQRAEHRMLRERARNARLAVAGFVVLALGLTVGLTGGWAPAGFGPPRTDVLAQPGSFAQTRNGSILFSSFDGVICKQLQFDNDTGRLTGSKLVRCDEAQAAAARAAQAAPSGPQVRTQSIRDAFTK